MNAHTTCNPLSARVDSIAAATGLFAATVAFDYGDPRVFPGYLTRGDALDAGARFSQEVFGRVPLLPADYRPRVRIGRHGDSRRRDRRQARARKESFLRAGA